MKGCKWPMTPNFFICSVFVYVCGRKNVGPEECFCGPGVDLGTANVEVL